MSIGDLKVVNIICGLQNHASMHPSCYCEVDKKSLNSSGTIRKFGSLSQCYQCFQQSDQKNPKVFKNTIHALLFEANKTKVLDVIKLYIITLHLINVPSLN